MALALAGGLLGYVMSRSGPGEEAQYETVPVDRGTIVARITATGTLSALVTVQVGSQVSGRIQEILADFNDKVEKGHVLARIDPRLFQAALEQAEANVQIAEGGLQKAKAQADQAERAYRRGLALSQRDVLSASDLDIAKANAAAARAEVKVAEGHLAQARAASHQARLNLGYTTIVSPIRGVVISRAVDVGQTVAASLQAPTLFTIAEDLSRMQVDTHVAEADIGRLKSGMSAGFTVDAHPGRKFRGTIRQIRHAPQIVQNVVTYNAVIDVDNPELRLQPGMTANVTIVYAERGDALRVPNASVRFRPPEDWLAALASSSADGRDPTGGRGPARDGTGGAEGAARPAMQGRSRAGGGSPDERTVWVLRERKPVPIPIRTGVSDGSMTEVLEGDLRPGDLAITDVQTAAKTNRQPGFMPRLF
jgi:HlyD family secretion protein